MVGIGEEGPLAGVVADGIDGLSWCGSVGSKSFIVDGLGSVSRATSGGVAP